MKSQGNNEFYVLDTHVLIWYFIGSKRLHRKLRFAVDRIRSEDGRILIPTIVLAEALDIAEKFRIEYDFDEMYRLIQENAEFEIVGFDVEVLNEALKLKKVKEIHDRIIVATARFYRAGILTKDRIILESGEVRIV